MIIQFLIFPRSYFSLDTNLGNKVGNEYTLLAQTSSTSNTNTVKITNLSQFKYIELVRVNSDGQFTNPAIIPLEVFKSLNSNVEGLLSGLYNQAGNNFVVSWYVDDTKVGLFCQNGTDTAKLYGIK